MKAVKIIGGVVACVVALFVLHVPVLRAVSSVTTSSELRAYPQISEGLRSESYEVVRLLYGTSEVWFDQQAGLYLIVGDLIKSQDITRAGRYVISVDGQGHLLDRRRVSSETPIPDLEGDPRYTRLQTTPARQYVPDYRFDALAGRLDLVKYQFTKFSDWPYFYYGFPVIQFDWQGVGYYRLTHQNEAFLFQLPTDFYGGPLYAKPNVDGQLYLIERHGPFDVGFLKVAESSYTRGMNGEETHRDGYGLYVIRPRQD